MRHDRILALLILCEFALTTLGITLEYAVEPFLLDGGTTAAGGALASGLWLAVMAGTIVSWVGLLGLLRAARPLYAGTWAAYIFLILLRGPVLDTSLGSAVQMLTAMTGGAIIGLIYFSDLRTRFRSLAEMVGTAVRQAT